MRSFRDYDETKYKKLFAIWKKKNTFSKSMNRFVNIYPQL